MKTVIVGILCVLAIGDAQSDCLTPNGEIGKCGPIIYCFPMVQQFSDPTDAFNKFLQDSLCGGGSNDNPNVCCGTVGKYQTLKATAPPTPQSVPKTKPPARQQVRVPPPLIPVRRPASSSNTYRHRNLNLLPDVGACGSQNTQDRAFGGETAGIDEFPWMALLEYKKDKRSTGHSCAGVILNERYVLTAAHCITGEINTTYGNVFRTRLGEYDKSRTKDCVVVQGVPDCADPHQDISVEEAFVHAEYDIVNRTHDIGLLRLASNIKMNSFVRPICLPINVPRSPPGLISTVAGWGLTEQNISSQIKIKINVPIVANQQCQLAYSNFSVQLLDSQLCAGAEQGGDSCRGDSGAPLMRTFHRRNEYFIEGIVSFGTTCGTIGVPGVYTRVSSFLDWILDHMKPFE